MAETTTAGAPVEPAAFGANVRQEITDALYLLDYAVANGVKAADGNPLSQSIVVAIKTAAEKVLSAAGALTAAEWAAFELAYYDLATALKPVTAETLRNTHTKPYEGRNWSDRIRGDSAAIRFTRLLWVITLSLAAFIIVTSWYLGVKAEEGNTGSYRVWRIFIEVVSPWFYGGLGACVYLLRSAHTYIHARSFDVRRKPEYLNRILLGAVGGGAILLFVNQITDDDGNVIHLSSAALGFLAGYNTDFLFTTLERVAAAILPKVGIDSVQKAAPGGTQPVNLNDLAERMDKATGAEKEFYRSMLAQLTGVRTPPRPAGG